MAKWTPPETYLPIEAIARTIEQTLLHELVRIYKDRFGITVEVVENPLLRSLVINVRLMPSSRAEEQQTLTFQQPLSSWREMSHDLLQMHHRIRFAMETLIENIKRSVEKRQETEKEAMFRGTAEQLGVLADWLEQRDDPAAKNVRFLQYKLALFTDIKWNNINFTFTHDRDGIPDVKILLIPNGMPTKEALTTDIERFLEYQKRVESRRYDNHDFSQLFRMAGSPSNDEVRQVLGGFPPPEEETYVFRSELGLPRPGEEVTDEHP